VNVAQIKRVFLAAQSNDQAALDAEMPSLNRLRTAVQTAGLKPALKSTKAHLTGEKRWLNTRAPLLNAERSIGKELSSLCV